MEAICKECGESKPFLDFDKKIGDGPLEAWNLRRCKACTHAQYAARYRNPQRRSAMTAASRNWKVNNPEQHAKLAREYRQRHPEKITAQNRLNYAVRKGLVVRGPCEVCTSTERVHAHHVSYDPSDWYNVRWLCFVCHKMEHTE